MEAGEEQAQTAAELQLRRQLLRAGLLAIQRTLGFITVLPSRARGVLAPAAFLKLGI